MEIYEIRGKMVDNDVNLINLLDFKNKWSTETKGLEITQIF